MYHTIEEVLLATKEKYQGVEELSRDDWGCRYAHDVNGVGCAIGCHLPPRVAKELDTSTYGGGASITQVLHSPTLRPVVAEYFDLESISESDLRRLQLAHDMSGDVARFIEHLDHRLESGEWLDPWN